MAQAGIYDSISVDGMAVWLEDAWLACQVCSCLSEELEATMAV